MSNKELKLEAVKCYKIRKGLKAELLAKRRGTWIGVIYVDGTAKPAGWNEDGLYDGFFNSSNSYLDIVDEWNDDDEWEYADPSKITLDMLPMPARFKTERDLDWHHSELRGIGGEFGEYFLSTGNCWWRQCQIRKGEK